MHTYFFSHMLCIFVYAKYTLTFVCMKPRTITEARLRSDNAGDYTGAAFVLSTLVADSRPATGGVQITRHSHSIAGEGKATNDMKNGLISQVSRNQLKATPPAGQSTCITRTVTSSK